MALQASEERFAIKQKVFDTRRQSRCWLLCAYTCSLGDAPPLPPPHAAESLAERCGLRLTGGVLQKGRACSSRRCLARAKKYEEVVPCCLVFHKAFLEGSFHNLYKSSRMRVLKNLRFEGGGCKIPRWLLLIPQQSLHSGLIPWPQ